MVDQTLLSSLLAQMCITLSTQRAQNGKVVSPLAKQPSPRVAATEIAVARGSDRRERHGKEQAVARIFNRDQGYLLSRGSDQRERHGKERAVARI